MAKTVDSLLGSGPPTGRGKALVGSNPDPDERPVVDVKASIFFDGTGNNRTNTELRLAAVASDEYVVVEGRRVKLEGSYTSYYSNVAVLEYTTLLTDETKEISVYVEGIGTEDTQADNQLGMGFGMGATGIPVKVTKGITKLTVEIDKILLDSQQKLGTLTVNVFGFSRGAAAARHFVARRTSEFFAQYISLSESLHVEAEIVTVNFVGLFDTVSSYGGEYFKTLRGQIFNKVVRHSFDDDVRELRLAIGGEARQVVQLAAADEYRANFALTNIQSSVRAGVGLEVRLPGVHSDIGGGYEERQVESYNFVSTAERQRLQAEGWYSAGQLSKRWFRADAFVGTRELTHQYQFVPLAVMLALAEQGGLSFKSLTGKLAAYSVTAELRPLAQRMKDYVLGRPGPRRVTPYEAAEFALPTSFHWVRSKYLHRSAVPGSLTMSGRTDAQGLPDRQGFADWQEEQGRPAPPEALVPRGPAPVPTGEP